MSFCFRKNKWQTDAERVLRHVVLKADVRDSTRLTRTMMDKGLNPASYFSLNFYDPVNKLAGEVWRAESVSGRRRHHSGHSGARRRTRAGGEPHVRVWRGRSSKLCAGITN